METMIKENNIKITTTINGNFNDKLSDFQTTLIKTCEDMNAQQMIIINFNMINIIKATLEEQRVTSQVSPPIVTSSKTSTNNLILYNLYHYQLH